MNRAAVEEDGSDSEWDTASASSASEKVPSGGQRVAYDWAFQHLPNHASHLATREAAQPFGLSSTVAPAHATAAHAARGISTSSMISPGHASGKVDTPRPLARTSARKLHPSQGSDVIQQDSGAVRIAPTAYHAPTTVSQIEMTGSSRGCTTSTPGHLSGPDSRRIGGERQFLLSHRGSRMGVIAEVERVSEDRCGTATQLHSMRSAEPVAADAGLARQRSPHHLSFSPSILSPSRGSGNAGCLALLFLGQRWNSTTGSTTMHPHEQSVEMFHMGIRPPHLTIITMRYEVSRSSSSYLTKSQTSMPYGGAKHATASSQSLAKTVPEGRSLQLSRNASSGTSSCPSGPNYGSSATMPDADSSLKKVSGEHATDRLAAVRSTLRSVLQWC
ncbi:hypothetical protein C8Q76DRAFT_696806 [Earliella scabrosa]|nr:hypothetical protein C8Q76DRAFT_696806 [Earliella scabrosa]